MYVKMKSLKGILFALISSGTFGLIPLFSIQLMEEDMEVSSILFYRFLLSTIIMGAICIIRKECFKISRKFIFTIIALSALYAATALLLVYSYNYIPSGIATTIHFMYPIAVSFIMVLFFKEKRSLILLIAAFISVVGVIFMCWTGGENIKLLGVIIVSLTVLTYSIYIVGINQTSAGRLPAEILTFYILLFGTIIFLVFALLTTGVAKIPSLTAFGRLSLLAFLCTVVSDFTLVLAIKLVGSTTTSILGSMEPLVAVSIGIIYFSEPFSINSLIGIILIIISVVMVVTQKSKNQSKDKMFLGE